MRDSIKHIRDIDPPCIDDYTTTPASGWMCGRCGQHVAYGEMHVCHSDWAKNTIMYSPPPTELSLEDRVVKLETYVDDLRKAVEQLIEWIPCRDE